MKKRIRPKSQKEKPKKKHKNPLADMAGILSSGIPDLSKNVDEIYDED